MLTSLQSWKPTFIVLRPKLLNMYRDESESRLRNQIKLNEVTAVARQKDPKRKEKHVFGIFTPSRNYHFEALSDHDAQDWIEHIRQEARIYEAEEEMLLTSPGGARSAYQGFERTIDSGIQPIDEQVISGYSSSDIDALPAPMHTSSFPKARSRGQSTLSARQPSYLEYSGTEGRGSYSDLSEAAGPAARLSALSLSHTDGRPSTSSALGPPNSVYGSAPARPSMGARNASQLSVLGYGADPRVSMQREQDPERIVFQGWILLLKSKRGVRQWKKIWMVLRPKGLSLYKNEEEYRAVLILPFAEILEAVEIDPLSKSKNQCMELICEERNYRFCARDEETLTKWLGSFKSLLSKRRAAEKDAAGQ